MYIYCEMLHTYRHKLTKRQNIMNKHSCVYLCTGCCNSSFQVSSLDDRCFCQHITSSIIHCTWYNTHVGLTAILPGEPGLTWPVNSASGNARPSTRPVLTGNGNRSPVNSGNGNKALAAFPSPYILFNSIPLYPSHTGEEEKGRRRRIRSGRKVHSMSGNWCRDFEARCPSFHYC